MNKAYLRLVIWVGNPYPWPGSVGPAKDAVISAKIVLNILMEKCDSSICIMVLYYLKKLSLKNESMHFAHIRYEK